jgi:hypothetical protein
MLIYINIYIGSLQRRVCNILTRKLPRVIAIKIEKSNEFNVKPFALYLTAKVELNKFFLSWMETKAGHNHIMLMIIINGLVVVVDVVFVVAHV